VKLSFDGFEEPSYGFPNTLQELGCQGEGPGHRPRPSLRSWCAARRL